MVSTFHDLRLQTEDILREFSGKNVFFFPNPGNGGDSIIASGTYNAFRKCGVSIEILQPSSDVAGKVVFLGGGGNYVELYTDISRAIETLRNIAAKIVVLPHTIRGNVEQLSSLDSRVTLICRDPVSYLHVISTNTKAEVYLAHDMAFHVDALDLLKDKSIAMQAAPVFQAKMESAGIIPSALGAENSVAYLRLDWESKVKKPTSYADISQIFALGVWPTNAHIATWCMLNAVSLAQKVVTDRLHVGISCALVGRSCELMDNSYGKNESVYKHSIKNRFPEVCFSKA